MPRGTRTTIVVLLAGMTGCVPLLGDFEMVGATQDGGDAGGVVDAAGGEASVPADTGVIAVSSCTCTPQPPAGWTLVALSTAQTSCAGAWGGSASTSYDGLTADAATCGCSCAVSGAGCAVSFTADSDCSYDCSGGCTGAVTNLMLASGACVPAAVQANAYQALSAPSTTGGSCTPTPSTNTPPIAWANTVTACAPTSPLGQGTCGGGDACIPAAPGGFKVCAEQAGDQACPFGTKQLEYTGASDTRGCSACTCGTPTGFSCGGSAVGYTSTDCSGTSTALACGPAFESVKYTAAPSGTCAAPGPVAAMGSATASGPITFCCL